MSAAPVFSAACLCGCGATVLNANLARCRADDVLSHSFLDTVELVVAEHYRVSASQFHEKCRLQKVAYARQVVVYLCRQMTDISFPQLGAYLGRHHTTLVAANQKVAARVSKSGPFAAEIARLKEKVRERL